MTELERDRLVTVLCNYCIGETAALEGASGLIAFAPNRLAKVFLATQVADEGRHLEVLLHRMRELGVAQPEVEMERRAGRSIQLFRQRLLELVASRDWEAAIFAQNVILEALEFAVFHSHAQSADPITREVLQWRGATDELAANEVICPVCKVVIRSSRELRPGDRVYCMPCMSRLVVVRTEQGTLEAHVAY